MREGKRGYGREGKGEGGMERRERERGRMRGRRGK